MITEVSSDSIDSASVGMFLFTFRMAFGRSWP